ncbi:MAG: MMPL family transporter, partial [Candidatus Aminicenantes bacterium]|nr:MMPL family transporter [Candidatus Aminicenantes bacterium]
KFKKFNIKATGYPITQFEGNEFFKKETIRNILISMIVAIFLLAIFLRSVRGVIFPIITTISSLLIVYGGMGYAGVKINNLVITIPLLLGMSISIGYSVHIFNFFRYRARNTGRRRESILYAMEHTGWPMFFTALTTFGSLLSFVLIPINILQWLGLTTALTIMVIFFIVITITPALLSFGDEKTSTDKYIVPKRYSSQSLSIKLGKLVLSNQRKIVIAVLILIIFSIFGIVRIKVKVDHKTTLGTKLNYIKKAHYIAGTKIGSLYNYNIILDFPDPESAKDPLVLKNLEILVNDIKGLELTKRVTSITDMIKELNQVVHGEDQKFYKVPSDRQQISHLLLLYEMSEGNQIDRWVDYDYKLLRIMVEVKDYDTSLILEEKEFLEKRINKLFPNAKAGFSGVLYRVAHVQNYILKGELISFFVAMMVIGFLMSVVFRSFRAGM